MKLARFLPALAIALASCGGPQPTAPVSAMPVADTAHLMTAAPSESVFEVKLENTDGECQAIFGRLEHDRETMAGTAEWQAVHQTPEWGKLNAQIQAASEAGCKPHDAQASETCKAITGRLRDAAQLLEKTPQWDALKKTDAYKVLHQAYADAREHDCWK